MHCVNRLPRCPASRPLRGPVTRRSAHLPLSSPITATRRFSMSHHRLFAQLAFERALGMAALNALAQAVAECDQFRAVGRERRSEEHTSELQSLMRISYAVFCLKKKKDTHKQ